MDDGQREHPSGGDRGAPTEARGAAHLPGRGSRRRQDVRDARRGAPPAGARHRRRGRGRRDPRPQEDRRPARRASRSCRRSYIDYRGSEFPELDVEAVLRPRTRRWCSSTSSPTPTPPAARTRNGGRTSRSCSTPGITVISTVNVQHLESLNDVVTQITGIEQQEKVPDEVVRAADQIELVDITPEALRRRLSHGNVYAPERVDAALSNYFRPGNLTALRELALLWLADQVDAALAKYRDDHEITDTWEARERVVVAVTGGAESETLVRRAFRIASKSSAELMVVHVVRGDGLSGVSAPQMGKVRELAAEPRRHAAHRRRRRRTTRAAGLRPRDERHPAGARHVATVAVGAHLRRGHRRQARAALRQDRRAHGHPRRSQARAGRGGRLSPATAPPRVLAGRGRGAVGDLRGHRAAARPVPRHRRRERPVLRRRAGGRAARRRRTGRTVGGVVRAAAQLLPGRAPLHVHHRRTRQRRSPSWCCSLVAVAVAALVDGAAKRAREARRASQEAELLALFAGSVLRGADLTRCWSGSARRIPSAR